MGKPGQKILVQDGSVVLEVTNVGEDYVETRVLNDGRLGEKKNVNVPGVKIDIPVVDEREIKDIKNWAVPTKADYIALSFTQSAADVHECRKHCGEVPIKIISKIENVEGLRNFDEILEASDGIMVARGDLGTEILASMEDKPFPTRAEACDVANAVLDGSSMVMLSGEVATGDFPLETVKTLRRIVEEAEFAMVE